MAKETDFEERMWDSIRISKKEYGYNPGIFIEMIEKYGIIEACKRVINDPQIPSGYTKLWDLNALHLSVEAIILEEEWKELFTEEERIKAKKRLKDYEYTI